VFQVGETNPISAGEGRFEKTNPTAGIEVDIEFSTKGFWGGY
jgi:hypothetical protein